MSTTAAPTVFVVDDDPAFLRAITRLLNSAHLDVRGFPNADSFLNEHDPALPGCLLLDVAMPGLNGLELQQVLLNRGCSRPIVFITGQGDIRIGVQAIKAGAIDVLTKPFTKVTLLAAVRDAFAKDSLARRAQAEREVIEQRLASLTAREREVLAHVISGRLNKQIADDLGAAEKTIKVHRARVMEKMGVRSVAELVRGLTGQEVQKELARTNVNVPTIVVTAHDEPKVRTALLAAGAVGYFCKPVERAELLAAIANATDRGPHQD